MSSPVVAARSPQGARRRESILDAATQQFLRAGYSATSLREIAEAAGISHPGLRRHFASKDEILAAVIERYDDENTTWMRAHPKPNGAIRFAEVARRNESHPGYLQLFTALTGEATSESHPAHIRMRDRYRALRPQFAAEFEASVELGEIGAGRRVADEAIRLAGAWDGLQVLHLYLPDRVDVAAALERRESLITTPHGWRDDSPGEPARRPFGPFPALVDGSEIEGYASGRARRARILQDAMTLFARAGYADTSMREIAESVGVSKSTLFHHYATKDELLLAVLEARDTEIGARANAAASGSAVDVLRDLPDGAKLNADEAPGLIEVYAVLSCEAVTPDHAAHDYFTTRFERALDAFTAMFERAASDGDLPAHRDPAHEAAWLLALWDGLQFQWLYDRESVDIAAQLRAHLDDVLPPR